MSPPDHRRRSWNAHRTPTTHIGRIGSHLRSARSYCHRFVLAVSGVITMTISAAAGRVIRECSSVAPPRDTAMPNARVLARESHGALEFRMGLGNANEPCAVIHFRRSALERDLSMNGLVVLPPVCEGRRFALDRDGVALESFAGLPDFVSSGHLVGTNQNSPSH